MRKEKFEKKVKDLISYEDKKFIEVLNFIKPYNEDLSKKNCEIICRRVWYYIESNQIQNFSNERLSLKENKGYACSISLQFQIIGADPDDEKGFGFQIIENVTTYGKTVFSLQSFTKYKLRFLITSLKKCFNEIEKSGIEQVSKKYNN